MRRILLLTVIVSLVMAVPVAGQYRGNRGGTTTTTRQTTGRRPNSGSQLGASRPESRPNTTRPSGTRPESRPNGARPNTTRPESRPQPTRPTRPASTPRPNTVRPYRPVQPPVRPHRPAPRPYLRPVPPSSYRPYASAPVLNAIFGLAFGVNIRTSIHVLSGSGYYIDGYGDRTVYLRNVSDMGYSWSDAVVEYDSGDRMVAVSLYESTAGYDVRRFNALYSRLCDNYGLPALRDFDSDDKSATWYDRYGAHTVTLSYRFMSSGSGYPRYYTILTYGN